MNGKQFYRQARQGDVLLTRVDAPISLRGARRIRPVGGRLILAYGEQTGHNHSVDNDLAQLFALPDGRTVLVAGGDTVLEHQEHAPIDISPGTYQVSLQEEAKPSASPAWKFETTPVWKFD